MIPVELQVIGAALRAIAEEMGAALDPLRVLGEHQGAPRLLDRALRRARAHGDAGRAHPGAPRRDARGGRGGHGARSGAGRAVDPQRPVRRRHAPARPHDRHADGARLRRHARAPRRRRRLRAGKPSAWVADARGGGRRHPADAPRRGDARASRRADAEPGRAPRRPAGAARGASPRRDAGSRSSARDAGRERVAAAMDELLAYSERVVRAAIRELPDGRFEGADALETRAGPARDPRGGDDRRRRDRHRLRRDGAAARREPQLPARGHALRVLLRRPLPDGARPAGLRRRVRARHRARARGLSRQRALARRGRRREHGDVEPHHGRRLRRVLARRSRSRRRGRGR